MQDPVKAGKTRLDSASLFHADGVQPFSVLEFWSWALSDLQDNANCGVLAEFIVAKAIGAEIAVRGSWDDFDLVAPSGISVEVKASAFLQAWNQHPKTPPSFANLKAKTEPFFRAAIYVFALQTAKTPQQFDPLDLGQWQFWVASLNQLRELNQNSMRLTTVCAQFGEGVPFGSLEARFQEVSQHVG
jgi:hypothetical protein